MGAETVLGLVILSIVALIMVIIGICQMKEKNNPVGFYNVIDPPKKEEITDIILWNKKHGMMWIVYGICIELGFWIGYVMPIVALEVLFLMGGIILPLPLMMIRHKNLVKQYCLSGDQK